MLERVGYASLDDLMAAAVPGAIRSRGPRPARRGLRAAGAAELRALAARNRPAERDDRARLPRHHHPGGDPAQRAGGPGLVHRLHAVPARDLPGPARGAAQLPDRRRRPHRPADRQRLAARRGHRGGRGDDAGTPGQPEGVRPASSSTPTTCRRRSRWCAPARRRWASRSSSPTSTDGLPRPATSCSACCWRIPRRVRPGRRPAAGDRGRPRARRPGRRRRRPAGADRCSTRRASSGPTSWSAPRSASACRSSTADRTPASWRCAPGSSGTCPAGWSASRSTPTAGRPTGWRCRPASSTSAARRPPPTSAPRRCCWPSWPPCTPSTTARTGLRAIATARPPLRRGARGGAAGRWLRGRARRVLRHPVGGSVPGRAEAVVAAARARGLHLRLVDADRGRHLHVRDHHAARR